MTAKSTQQGASDQWQSGSPRRRLPSSASPDPRKRRGDFLPTRLLKSAIAAQVVGLLKINRGARSPSHAVPVGYSAHIQSRGESMAT